MLTGDNPRAAAALAAEVGIIDVRAGLQPQDKVDAVRGLQADGQRVMLIGDGVNDAPRWPPRTPGSRWAAPALTWHWTPPTRSSSATRSQPCHRLDRRSRVERLGSCHRRVPDFGVGGAQRFPGVDVAFYELAGSLLAARTPAGYRLYGDDAVERLRFIANGLGLALEDIRELLGVWERGVCAQVRTQLRPLAANRISEAGQRIAELSAFVDALTQVHDDLGGPAPDGRCGPGCGCVSVEPVQPVSIELGPRPSQASPRPDPVLSTPVVIACTLTGDEQRVRRDEWAQLMATTLKLEHTTDGVRAIFPLDAPGGWRADVAGQRRARGLRVPAVQPVLHPHHAGHDGQRPTRSPTHAR